MVAGTLFAAPLMLTPALAQKAQVFGNERVQTREFRNKDVKRTVNSQKSSHSHSHSKKGHKGHNH
jgi:hypothetical protein